MVSTVVHPEFSEEQEKKRSAHISEKTESRGRAAGVHRKSEGKMDIYIGP